MEELAVSVLLIAASRLTVGSVRALVAPSWIKSPVAVAAVSPRCASCSHCTVREYFFSQTDVRRSVRVVSGRLSVFVPLSTGTGTLLSRI